MNYRYQWICDIFNVHSCLFLHQSQCQYHCTHTQEETEEDAVIRLGLSAILTEKNENIIMKIKQLMSDMMTKEARAGQSPTSCSALYFHKRTATMTITLISDTMNNHINCLSRPPCVKVIKSNHGDVMSAWLCHHLTQPYLCNPSYLGPLATPSLLTLTPTTSDFDKMAKW